MAKSRSRIPFLIALLILGIATAVLHRLCYIGERSEEAFWSTNGKYRVVKDRTWTLRAVIRELRGRGRGAPEGYVRLYDASGRKVREEFMSGFDDVRPVWNHREVYFFGRGPSWPLPEDSEL